jgi:hypothetical protein
MKWPLVIMVNVMFVGALADGIGRAASSGRWADLVWSFGFASALFLLDFFSVQTWLQIKSNNKNRGEAGDTDEQC